MTEITEETLIFRLFGATDPDEYASHLADPHLFDGCDLPSEIDFSSIVGCKCACTPWGKRRMIEGWFTSNSACFLKGVNVHFPVFSKYGCHMDDAGNVCFPFKVWCKRFDAVVKYLFHESAHLWLLKQPYYADLLKLDKAFLSRYGKRERAICLSPVEYLASRLSLALLERAAACAVKEKTAKRLLLQKKVEERKLSGAIDAFETKD